MTVTLEAIYFPRHGKKDAMDYARKGTRYLSAHGCSEILSIVRLADGWNVQVSSETAQCWPNLADLLTE